MFKPTAERVSRIIQTPSRGGGSTRRWTSAVILRPTIALLVTWSVPGAATSDYLRTVTLEPGDLSSFGIELTIAEVPRQLVSVTLALTPRFACNLENASITLRGPQGRVELMSELAVKSRSIFFLVAREQLQAAEVSLTCKLAEPRHYDQYILRLSA